MKPETIAALLARIEPRVRDAFLAAIADVRSEAQLAVIAGALRDGRLDDALRALNLGAEFFAPLDDALRAAYLEGGRNALVGLPVLPSPFPQGVWLSALMAGTSARKRG